MSSVMIYLKLKEEVSYIQNYLLASIAILLLFLIPSIIEDPYIWGILVMANIYAAFGASFDLLLGYAGMAVLGYGLFVGVGAYSAAFLNLYLGMPPWLTMPTAGIIGALFGLLIGIPCLRLRGLYLALATFAAAAICEKIIIVFHDITYGREGLSGLDPFSLSTITDYYVSLLMMLASTGLLVAIVRSKIGLIVKSIRDDEAAAEAVGINTNRYKLFVFLISSFLGGLWGGFFAHYMRHIGPEIFGLHMAITIIMVTIVGGMGTITGPIGGAYLLIILNELLREVGEVRLLIYSVFTIFIMLLLPQGTVPPATRFIIVGLKKVTSFLHNRLGSSKHNVSIPRS